MRKVIGLSALSSLVLVLPALASAQAVGLMGTLITINRFLNGLIGIIITIAIIVFFWGLVRYLTNAGEEKHNGLITMFYGLIAIFVMVSVWGIIHLLQATFGIQGANQAIVPAIIPAGSTNY
jgi:uncharacterized membrane protein YesL